jgi:hypothetical protein
MTKAELDARLSRDNEFLLNQVLAGMSMLFTEFVGFVLYRALGESIHHYGNRLLNNYSFASLAKQYAPELVKEQIDTGTFAEHDLLSVLWLLFVETIEDMINSGWGESYRAAQ